MMCLCQLTSDLMTTQVGAAFDFPLHFNHSKVAYIEKTTIKICNRSKIIGILQSVKSSRNWTVQPMLLTWKCWSNALTSAVIQIEIVRQNGKFGQHSEYTFNIFVALFFAKL